MSRVRLHKVAQFSAISVYPRIEGGSCFLPEIPKIINDIANEPTYRCYLRVLNAATYRYVEATIFDRGMEETTRIRPWST